MLLDHVAREPDLARGLVDLVLLDEPQGARPVRFNGLEDAEIAATEEAPATSTSSGQSSRYAASAREAEESAASGGVIRKAPHEVAVAGRGDLALAERLVREPAVEEARRRDLSRRGRAGSSRSKSSAASRALSARSSARACSNCAASSESP